MEHSENNIIRQKLESLDTLPENYDVNLASKFDLVMQANIQPKHISKLWFILPVGIAASILMVFFMGDLNPRKGVSASISEVQRNIELPLKMTSNQTALGYPTRPKLKEKQKQKSNSKQPAIERKTINQQLVQMLPTQESSDSMLHSKSLLANELPVKNKKSRFREMDFNEQIIPEYLVLESKKENHFFKLKLPEGVLVNSMQSGKTLSYRQTF